MTTYTIEARSRDWFGESFDGDYLLFVDGEQVGTITYRPLAELVCRLLNDHNASQAEAGEAPRLPANDAGTGGHLWGPPGREQ